MIRMRLKDGTVYTLDDDGAVVARSDGPQGWDYSGQWLVVGFLKRHHSHHMVTLAEALDGIDVGHGWVVDNDHGTFRMWAHPSYRRLASLEVTR
jgi:hypothetical protein